MPRYGWNNFYDFPASRPIAAKGGIKAHSKRGQFGTHWWAQRWVQVLESFDVGGRLDRGRSYARKGQVLSIDIEPGIVKAKVQGSMPTPYAVQVKLKALEAADETKLAEALSQDLASAARLLSGSLPEELEATFANAGLNLFPEKGSDLQTKCSCPDWSNPCKHVAATYYLLAEEFDRDPFLLLKLRGIDRDRLLNLLQKAFPILAVASGPATEPKPDTEQKSTTPAKKKSLLEEIDVEQFWRAKDLDSITSTEARIPATTAPAIRRLGAFPFWRGETSLEDVTYALYLEASKVGQRVAAGEVEDSK